MTDILSSVEQAVTHPEETWDALASSDIATVIPVAGRFVKVWRGIHDFRAALFAAKLRAFITDPSLQTPEARARMRERAESEEAKKIGETLFLVLERLSDLQKPLWLAKVYAAYLAKELKSSDLRRLASAIDTAFGDDLIELISSPETPSDDFVAWKRNLAASGLTEMASMASGLAYNVSDWGRMLRKAVRDHS
jgi:hypothetical protein